MLGLETLRSEGSLKTYGVGGGFINVYWSHPSLGTGVYVLFKFLESSNELLDIRKVSPSYLPLKYKAKKYNAKMIELVKSAKL